MRKYMQDNSKDNNSSDSKISRRDFIKFVGAAGAVLTLPSLIPLGRVFGANTTGVRRNVSSQVNATSSQLKTNTKSIYTYNLDIATPQTSKTNGTRTMANADNFPILSGMGIALLRLSKGVREPHWHPNAAELDYVIDGKARMTIFSPDGTGDTFEVGPGQIVFIPPAYFHYIENTDPVNTTHFAVFFNHERPEDTGISGALSS